MLDTSFQSANFTLKDSHDLADFKDYLIDYGFSQVREVGSIREFIVIKDSTYNSTIASITQQIQYINFLYPFLYVLVGIIAITASYLLVVHRKSEFAIHRGLGSTRIRTFFSFFLEQIILCIFGIGVGFLIWYLIWGNITILHLEFAAGFAVCFFLGSAISIMIMNHSNVLTILLDRE
jgi:ABC-type lipoprotein release transport system permease subunit